MDEYIKREDALDAVLFALVGTGHQSTAINAIRDIPTADVAPKSEVARLEIEIEALKIANEKMYSANEETEAEVVKEIISIIEQRDESNDEHACGVKNEILSALYRGKKDAYRDIKEILEQKCGVHTNNGVHTNKGRCRHAICSEARHEVAREIFAGVKLLLQNMADKYGYKASLEPNFDRKKEYRGAQIGVSVALHSVVAYEEELKKRYTEDQHDSD